MIILGLSMTLGGASPVERFRQSLWKGEQAQTWRQWLQTAGSSWGTGGSLLNQCEYFPGWSIRAQGREFDKSEKEFDKAHQGGLESRDGDREDTWLLL